MRKGLSRLYTFAIINTILWGGIMTSIRADSKILEVSLLYHPRGQNSDIALIIRQNLEKIGIKVNLRPELLGNYLTKFLNGDFDLIVALESFPLYPDTDSILYPLHAQATAIPGTPFYTIHRIPAVNDLIMDARNLSQEIHEGNRALYYMNAVWLIHKDVPYIPLVAPLSFITVVNDLENVMYSSLGYHYNSYANVTYSNDNTLKIAQGLDIRSLDPANVTETQEWHVIRQIYDGLYNVRWNFTEVVPRIFPPPDIPPCTPALATGYVHTDDFKEWTFSLRKNVKFHDGTPFNASAVKFTFERIIKGVDPESPYSKLNWATKSPYGNLLLTPLNLSISWNETDPYTVKFTLEEPLSVLDRMLSFLTFGIVSPTYVQTHNSTHDPNRLAVHPVGTGPFKFIDYSPEKTITLQRNSDYWGTISGSIEQIVFKTILDSNTAVMELLAEDIHICDELLFNYADYEYILDNDKIKVLPVFGKGYKCLHLLINSYNDPFNDEIEIDDPDFGGSTTRGTLIRRALAYAINRTTIAEEIFNGLAEIPNSCLDTAEEYSGNNSTFSAYPYNPSLASAILSELGYANSNGNLNFPRLESFMILLAIIGALSFLFLYSRLNKLLNRRK